MAGKVVAVLALVAAQVAPPRLAERVGPAVQQVQGAVVEHHVAVLAGQGARVAHVDATVPVRRRRFGRAAHLLLLALVGDRGRSVRSGRGRRDHDAEIVVAVHGCGAPLAASSQRAVLLRRRR